MPEDSLPLVVTFVAAHGVLYTIVLLRAIFGRVTGA